MDEEVWKDVKNIIVFGYGRQAKKVIEKFSEYFTIEAIIDNDKNKWGKLIINDLRICSLRDAEQIIKKKTAKIIVMAMGRNYGEIAKSLIALGLTEYVDFIRHEMFITKWFSKFRDKCFILKTDLFVTNVCNLNCEKCASFVPYIRKKEQINSDIIKHTLDDYFKICDYVFSMDIFGGEPFLYEHLKTIIEYIGSCYSLKIGYIGIITNGFIPPSNDLLEVMSKYGIGVSISDYSKNSIEEEKIDALCMRLEKKGIRYFRNRNLEWRDLGFPVEYKIRTSEKALMHRKACGNMCHVLYDGRLFYCAAAAAAYHGGLFNKMEGDYISLDNDTKKDKLMDFVLGNVNVTYQGFCSVCDGYGSDNPKVIPAAEQYE